MSNMATVSTCSKCGLSYYDSLIPHKCAEWTKGRKEAKETRPMSNTLLGIIKIAISDKERDADQLDQWANESKRGGWSTHQVEPMRKQADRLRREASQMRQDLNRAAKEVDIV